MTIQRLGFLAVAIFAILSGPHLAVAQSTDAPDTPDPERIARRCAEAVNRIADRCVAANGETARRCIRHINELLEAGDVEGARRAAHRCLNVIEERSDDCVAEIHQRCRECIRVLVRLGEPELARRLHHICEEAVERVRHSQRRASNAIRSQFDDV